MSERASVARRASEGEAHCAPQKKLMLESALITLRT